MSDYSELKKLAEASRIANHDERGPDEAFQEAAHPEVVLALIAELEQARGSRDQYRDAVDEWQDLAARRAQRMTELAQAANAAQDQAHRSRMDLVDQVERCDQLKAENEALRAEVKELHRKIGGSATHPDKGHGHVFPRADGVRMRCGGPGMCKECSADLLRKETPSV